MSRSKVYYQLVKDEKDWDRAARAVLEQVVKDIKLSSKLTLKIHSGQPGNTSFIQQKHMEGVIDLLQEKDIDLTFMETNTAGGARSEGNSHRQVAKEHGFIRLPFVVADGDNGMDHVMVPIKNGKHFKKCKIARQLHESKQVLVISHFKGHIMTGFGGAIKMLGIGYASARGKIEAHAIPEIPDNETIDWGKAVKKRDKKTGKVDWNNAYVYDNVAFMQRTAEYALAAKKPNDIHLVYAVNLVRNCDCDGQKMEPIYNDLGIFASTNPVAVDKAILDMLDEREGEPTYWGRQIFDYSEEIGLGSQDYELIEV
ncbi:DUF362 domain-containing protein [Candidatus Woesebacteria bacterium]|nr:DUF362 domain-containing protein [Candidatus Woesebacteria bacterium]